MDGVAVTQGFEERWNKTVKEAKEKAKNSRGALSFFLALK